MKTAKIKDKKRVLSNRQIALLDNQEYLITVDQKIFYLQQKEMNGTEKRSFISAQKEKTKTEKRIESIKAEIEKDQFYILQKEEQEEQAKIKQEFEEHYLVLSMMEQFKGIQIVVMDAKANGASMDTLIKVATLGEHDKIFQRTSSTLFRLSGITLEDCKRNFPAIIVSKKAKTKEHIDGRTNIILYFYRALLKKEITTVEEAVKWIRRYSVWIHTTAKFNMYVEKFQNDKNQLITVETYVKAYEDFYHVKLSQEEIEKMRYHFLSTTYGITKFPKEDLINLIVANNKPVKPISKFRQIIKILFN
jgi:hypothetical protein